MPAVPFSVFSKPGAGWDPRDQHESLPSGLTRGMTTIGSDGLVLFVHPMTLGLALSDVDARPGLRYRAKRVATEDLI